jgi:hypothetical protein
MNPSATAGVWLAGVLLQFILVGILTYRGSWRRFPVFTIYLVANILLTTGVTMVRYMAGESATLFYFYFYGLSKTLGLTLGLGTIFEVFSHLLTPYPTVKKVAMAACSLAVVLLIAAGALLVYSQPSANPAYLMLPFLKAEEAVRILQVGLVLFLCFFARSFRLHWRQTELGIALGMGIFAALDLAAVGFAAYYGESAKIATSMVALLAYNAALLVWLAYLLPARAPRLPRWSQQGA